MRYKFLKFSYLIILLSIISCQSGQTDKSTQLTPQNIDESPEKDTVIVDCNYSFQQAVYGSRASKEIINQLELIDIMYYSVDNKIHKGQVLTNKKIAGDLKEMFQFMLKEKFKIEHAIPVVKYRWHDDLSMQDNNTYSFCYRDENFSKHASGMAIDINPFLNPVRWKEEYEYRQDRPFEAHRDTTVNGTFYISHPVVQEFIRHGFLWGHNFKIKYDDHHFEK
ncbi:MAG: M15 family metallopeptidase [Paludibacter sp.]